MRNAEQARRVVGWDVGGAHLKGCLAEDGFVRDVAQWPTPLWRGLEHLPAALADARSRWPQAWDDATRHVATMTGEMADLFSTRAQGVVRLGAVLAEHLGPTLLLYAGDRWVAPHEAQAHWTAIASANWRATADWLAARSGDALLVDIGSTTTDLVVVRDGRVAARGRNDAERLASGELVYQGVVRTPLCALAARVAFGGHETNVMNELFATTADVYRLTGELDPAHDQQPAADGAGKDLGRTRQRLARMVGRDADDADAEAWLALAHAWRDAQLREIEGQLRRVEAASGLPSDAVVVAAGCGAFLAGALAARLGRRWLPFAQAVPFGSATLDGDAARWAGVCAPAVCIALLAGG
jgi:probable H4MPT-linked C1 transfer pathway protein